MKDALIDLITNVKKLRIVQKGFRLTLEETYPYLEKVDTDDLLRNISTELNLLLSSSIILKTGRIEIPVLESSEKLVILTRKPGLKKPFESYPVVELDYIRKMNNEGNIITKNKEKILMSILKGDKRIKQDKLVNFWQYLKRLCNIRKVLESLIVEEWYEPKDLIKDGKACFQVKDSFIVLGSEHFKIEIKQKNNSYETLKSERLADYSEEDSKWDQYPPIHSLEIVRDFFKKYDEILQDLNERKGKVVKLLKALLQNLQEENKPYKIMQKLLIKS